MHCTESDQWHAWTAPLALPPPDTLMRRGRALEARWIARGVSAHLVPRERLFIARDEREVPVARVTTRDGRFRGYSLVPTEPALTRAYYDEACDAGLAALCALLRQ